MIWLSWLVWPGTAALIISLLAAARLYFRR
jgi:hypothetical protein